MNFPLPENVLVMIAPPKVKIVTMVSRIANHTDDITIAFESDTFSLKAGVDRIPGA